MDLSGQVNDVLELHKGLREIELFDGKITLTGSVHFNSKYSKKELINDSYLLKISIDPRFPNILPNVYEIEGKIPREIDRHIFSSGKICLGSPLSLQLAYSEDPTINGFIEMCIIPFLYANSYFERNEEYPWGDLDHGYSAVIDDYLDIFKLTNQSQLIQALKILIASTFNANKMRCPCGCRKRFKQCDYSKHLLTIKPQATKFFFNSVLKNCIDNQSKSDV